MFGNLFAKVRTLTNKARRPSPVTHAQHAHVKAHPDCAACGSLKGAQGHHIVPFNKRPDLGAHPENFITLCEPLLGTQCHRLIGHGGRFTSYNPNVVADAQEYRATTNVQHRAAIVARAQAARLDDKPDHA